MIRPWIFVVSFNVMAAAIVAAGLVQGYGVPAGYVLDIAAADLVVALFCAIRAVRRRSSR